MSQAVFSGTEAKWKCVPQRPEELQTLSWGSRGEAREAGPCLISWMAIIVCHTRLCQLPECYKEEPYGHDALSDPLLGQLHPLSLACHALTV